MGSNGANSGRAEAAWIAMLSKGSSGSMISQPLKGFTGANNRSGIESSFSTAFDSMIEHNRHKALH